MFVVFNISQNFILLEHVLLLYISKVTYDKYNIPINVSKRMHQSTCSSLCVFNNLEQLLHRVWRRGLRAFPSHQTCFISVSTYLNNCREQYSSSSAWSYHPSTGKALEDLLSNCAKCKNYDPENEIILFPGEDKCPLEILWMHFLWLECPQLTLCYRSGMSFTAK